jgi:hypothetical protein
VPAPLLAARRAALSPALHALLAAPGRRVPTVLVAGETNCFLAEEPLAFDARRTRGARFPCLNSGQYAGPAGDLARFLASVAWDFHMNDQLTFYIMFGAVRRDPLAVLAAADHDADVFLSLWGLEAAELALDVRSRSWRHAGSSGAAPSFWHNNGWIKRTGVTTGLLAGDRGSGTKALVQRALLGGAGAGVALFALGAVAGRRMCSAAGAAAAAAGAAAAAE